MDRPFVLTFAVHGKDFIDAGRASTEIKSVLTDLGLDPAIIRRVAIASYEAEMNVVMYANEATLTLELTPKNIIIVVDDQGPGIPNIELAMQEGFSTATPEMREMGFGAGMGLPNIKRNADDFAIQSTVGKGTTVTIQISIN
ncbi:MAG TPA: ATP-binding protein [Bacteroidota bacterium]|nr:ATP-binding protein [Bacteroidota bacterium]